MRRSLAVTAAAGCLLPLAGSASAAPVAPAIITQVGASVQRSGAFMQRIDFDGCGSMGCINRAGSRIAAFAAKEDGILRGQWLRSSPSVRATPCIGSIYRRSLQLTGTLGSIGKAFGRLTEANSDTELTRVLRRSADYQTQARQLATRITACGKAQA